MIKERYNREIELLGMKIEINSNYRDILYDDEYFLGKNAKLHSLLSNFHRLTTLESDKKNQTDVSIVITDEPDSEFTLTKTDGTYLFSGPVKHFEKNCEDKRISIFGNMGIFSKILVRELEQRGIFSFHSTSFVQPGTKRLYLVLGSSGAGKSTVLLKAVKEGQQVFGTELTHFKIVDNKVVFLKGSLWQNCRMGNLVEDFPSLLDTFSISYKSNGNPWHQYLSVDLNNWQHSSDILDNPEVVILFPRIESERKKAERYRIEPDNVLYSIYENLSDKVSPPTHLYKKVFLPSLDIESDQIKRMRASEEFIKYADIRDCWKFLSAPEECLDNVLL
jgi:hypothetical protein